MNKTVYIVIAIIVVALGAWLWMNPAEVGTEQAGETATSAETQAALPPATDDIDAVNVDDADFTSIDADLEAL